jgi:hypothetical protein
MATTISCLILLLLQFDFSNSSNIFFIFFDSYLNNLVNLIILIMLFFNVIIFIKCFLTRTLNGFSDIRNNRDLLVLMFFSIITKLSVFIIFYANKFEQDQETINYNISGIPFFYIMHLVLFSMFFIYFFYWAYCQLIEKFEYNHWIIEYLTLFEHQKMKIYTVDNKITNLSVGDIHLNELKGIITINSKLLNLKVFKNYLESKKCKLNELTPEDILIIEMLSI